jgi:hypothetical protein
MKPIIYTGIVYDFKNYLSNMMLPPLQGQIDSLQRYEIRCVSTWMYSCMGTSH